MHAGRRRTSRTPRALLYLPVAVGLALSACDIPTRGPDFSFRPQASGPLIFEKTLLFLGPDGSGLDALIDTTDATFDSLFSVDPADEGVYIVQDLDGFDVMEIDDAMGPIGVEPEDVVVTIGDLASQSVETSYENKIGILEAEAAQTPWLSSEAVGSLVYVPLSAGDVFTVPTNGVIDLSGADIERVNLTDEAGPAVNRLSFQLANGLGVSLTDATERAGTPPWIVLETRAGTEIARTPFDRSPGSGETSTASVDLSGLTIPADSRFRLDLSTSQGLDPVASNPSAIEVSIDASRLRYSGFTVSSIPATSATASRDGLSLAAEVDFTGITTRSGAATVRLTNNLPIAVQLQSLTVTNTSQVDTYPNGHIVINESGHIVPANSAIDIPVSIGANAISRIVDFAIVASSQPLSPPTSFADDDGLTVSVTGDLDVDVIRYRPAGEVFRETSTFAVETTEVTFASPSDYVEVESGVLNIVDLVNGLDLTFDDVTISFPDILRSPYGPEDSLVVNFSGSSDGPNGVNFAKLERNAPPRDVGVDLAGMRISALGNEVRYSVVAVSETSGSQRVVAHDDEITTTAEATDLVLSRISAVAEPFSSLLTDDVNGDGIVDPLAPGEASVSDLDDFGPLNDVTGLELVGAELSVHVTTTMTGDLAVYGILAGEDADGNITYLQGRSGLAVSTSDSMVQSFAIRGVTPGPEEMFVLPLSVRGTPGQPSTHSIVLSDANSNISEFVSALPTTLRFVGKAVVGSRGGRIEVAQPSTVDLRVGIAIPLNVRGSFELRRTESANLTSLADLTDPDADFTAESATLTLAYSNRIPIGLQARLEFLDGDGSPTVSLPLDPEATLALSAAPSNGDGYASGSADGELDFGLSDADLMDLARSENLRLVITFAAPDPSSGRIRASDTIRLALRGDFRLNVTVGG